MHRQSLSTAANGGNLHLTFSMYTKSKPDQKQRELFKGKGGATEDSPMAPWRYELYGVNPIGCNDESQRSDR